MLLLVRLVFVLFSLSDVDIEAHYTSLCLQRSNKIMV